MKALVVGGNGFIGSHLVDRLIAEKWEVTVLDVYERRYEAIPDVVHFIRGSLDQEYLLREALMGVDVVYHLAWATIHEVSNRDPAADVQTNLITSIRLIEACRQAGIRRFVFTSSGGTVYGPAQTVPITETHRQNPVTAYGISKLAVEKYLHMFRHLYGLDYVIFRPSVPYGPRQNPLAKQGAVAVFLYRVANGLPLSIWGDGQTSRDYFHVSDLVEALLSSATSELGDEPIFNIGGPEEVTLNGLVTLVEETVGKAAVVEYLPGRSFDAPRVVLDTSRAKTCLRWEPSVRLRSGLAHTWDWMSRTIK
jgi:UDP-glucose 4-epimerase